MRLRISLPLFFAIRFFALFFVGVVLAIGDSGYFGKKMEGKKINGPLKG